MYNVTFWVGNEYYDMKISSIQKWRKLMISNNSFIQSVRPLENIVDNGVFKDSSSVVEKVQKVEFVEEDVPKEVLVRRKALTEILDSFAGDYILTERMEPTNKAYGFVHAHKENAKAQMNRIDYFRNTLKESMGIADDSKEQMDLELLVKRRRLLSEGKLEQLSDSERKQLKEIGTLTEYQQKALEFNDMENYWSDTFNDIKRVASSLKANNLMTDEDIKGLKVDNRR
jgi:hypothetical protein